MTSSPLSELSVEALLQRVREGEKGAWEELLGRSQSDLGRWAARRLGSSPPGGIRPSDVTQEAALGAFERFSSFRGTGEGEWRVWLEQVLHSRCVDMLRKAGSQKRDDSKRLPLDAPEAQGLPALQRSPSLVSSQQEQWRQLLTHFYQLPDAQREALSLYYLRDSTIDGIAERLGRSRAAVESLLQRGLRALRAGMEGREDSGIVRNQVDAALSVYFRRREEGVPVDPEAFAASYPECVDELRGLLHWLEELRALQPSSPA